MSLVSVKNKYQVVIPQNLREQLGINRGDLLEAKIEHGKLTYTRKAVIDRIPEGTAARRQFFKQLREQAPEWLQDIWAESKRKGLDKLTMRQIDAIISEARQEQQARKKIKTSPR
jgi:bifunctional DNA-binding transcriptional regulator/antitoxin component of YhaV-PrlF toxin-antitoxin module